MKKNLYKYTKNKVMNIYKHQGAGHYLGSVIIVKALSITEAEKIIKNELIGNGLPDEELNVQIVSEDIIYVDNGDY